MTDTAATVPVPEWKGRLGSLVASARRLIAKDARLGSSRRGGSGDVGPQDEAWDMYAQVGELRFLVSTLAARAAQARLYVGEVADDPNEAPVPTEDQGLIDLLNGIGGGPLGRTPLIYRLCVNLFVPGEGWLVGIPGRLLPVGQRPMPSLSDAATLSDEATQDFTGGFAVDDLEWRVLSRSEVTGTVGGDEVTLTLGDGADEKLTCHPTDVFLLRIWQEHPRYSWQADSPTISVLPVLRKIVGLDLRDMAQIKSRLAGAGLLLVPSSAQRSIKTALGLPENDESDPFTDALIEAMMTPIQDRGSASAFVPLIGTVPDEVTGSFHYLDFAKELDAASPGMLDQAVRRLALGWAAPPELLLGTSGMNHWGAFLVQEDTISTHVEPPLSLICDAITREFLWPVLRDQGMQEEQVRRVVVWHDTSDLVSRPNRSTDAMELHSRDVLSDEALRAETGFDDSQAPFADLAGELPVEVRMALAMAKVSPALVAAPGLPQLAAQIKAVLEGDIPDVAVPLEAPPAGPASTEGDVAGPVGGPDGPDRVQVPETSGAPPSQPPPGVPSGASVAASGWPGVWNGGAS